MSRTAKAFLRRQSKFGSCEHSQWIAAKAATPSKQLSDPAQAAMAMSKFYANLAPKKRPVVFAHGRLDNRSSALQGGKAQLDCVDIEIVARNQGKGPQP